MNAYETPAEVAPPDLSRVGVPATAPGESGTTLDHEVLQRLDVALLGMRRLALKPPIMTVPIPGTTRRLDFAKLLALGAIERLERTGDEATVKAVAATLELEHSTASRLVTEAESEGLVLRQPHPHDRRSAVLSFTDEGREIAEAFEAARLRFVAGTLASWSPADVAMFATLLDRFVQTVSEQRECWPDWISEGGHPDAPAHVGAPSTQ